MNKTAQPKTDQWFIFHIISAVYSEVSEVHATDAQRWPH